MEFLQADSSQYIVEVDNVVVKYGRFEALRGVSLGIPRGATGLVGRNGAGKSTLLRLLLGLVQARSGTGRVLDIPLTASGRKLRFAVGYMPENDSLVPGLRGVEQVALAGELCGLSRRTALRRAHDLLGEVDLGEARYRPVEQYSTGMKQRLKLAVALAHDPQLLLLDEPTVGLDPPGRRRMLELMTSLTTRHGKSLLISTHLLDDIHQSCQNVVMIEKGKILSSGPIHDVLGNGRQLVRIEWEGDGDAFIRSAAEQSLSIEKSNPASALNSLHAADVELPPGFDNRRLFALARASGIRLRTLHPKNEDLGELYQRLVEPTAAEAEA